jgi:iron complex transport system permease protein
MKVVLDLPKLVEEGKITPAEATRLGQLAAHDTGSLAINILIGLGVVAVAGGALALAPSPATAIVIGAIALAIGVGVVFTHWTQWRVLANICILAGALMFGGGIIAFDGGSVRSFLVVAAVLAAAGIVARSGLLIACAVLAVSSCVGARTGYMHASYFLGIKEPTLTIVLFSLTALGTYQLSKHLRSAYEGLALVAARVSLFLVNFGFWIGSLWGDRLEWLRSFRDPSVIEDTAARGDIVSAEWFVIAWAVVLLGTGIWAVRANRRWVVTIVAIFGAIHFYTQWFERLGATPLSVLIAGLITLAAAVAIWNGAQPGNAGRGRDRLTRLSALHNGRCTAHRSC